MQVGATIAAIARRRTAVVMLRILLGTVGAYMLSSALVALLAVVLPMATALSRSDAAMLSAMLGFLLLLVIALWAFTARRLIRVLLVTGAATCGCAALAWLAA
jgi:hypothetical protein